MRKLWLKDLTLLAQNHTANKRKNPELSDFQMPTPRGPLLIYVHTHTYTHIAAHKDT